MDGIGKFLVVVGVLIALVGAGLMFFDKIPFLGKLPGDITIKRENFKIYVPVGTSIALSVLISIVLWIVSHLRK